MKQFELKRIKPKNGQLCIVWDYIQGGKSDGSDEFYNQYLARYDARKNAFIALGPREAYNVAEEFEVSVELWYPVDPELDTEGKSRPEVLEMTEADFDPHRSCRTF